jgi:hypothetical protein
VRWSFWNTTLVCKYTADANASANTSALAAAHQVSSTAIAGSADELLFMLATPNVTRIVLAGALVLETFRCVTFGL